jgi:hypothetical protein
VTLGELRQVLGPDHPHTLASATSFATDLAQNHESAAARSLSERTFAASCSRRGKQHPDTLACQLNLALDRKATGDHERSRELFKAAAAALTGGPAWTAATQGERVECDVEPPPA